MNMKLTEAQVRRLERNLKKVSVPAHVRVVIESYCYQCGKVRSGHGADSEAEHHAAKTGHRVRLTHTIITVYNEKDDENDRPS